MSSETPPPSKAMFWGGWILTALPALMLIMSGIMKLMGPKDLQTEFTRLGYPLSTALPIGIIELVCVALYLIPRTSVLGAILLTGYLGGATATHVRIGDPWFGPVIMGVVLWLGLFLRDAGLRALIPLRS